MHRQETSIALDHPGNHVHDVCFRRADMKRANVEKQFLSNGLNASNTLLCSQSIVMEGKLKLQREETLMWISRFALERLRHMWSM